MHAASWWFQRVMACENSHQPMIEWELVGKCPSNAPEEGWLWGVSYAVSQSSPIGLSPQWRDSREDCALFTGFLPCLTSHWPTSVSQDHLSNKLLTLEPLSQHLLLGERQTKTHGKIHQNSTSDFSLDGELCVTSIFVLCRGLFCKFSTTKVYSVIWKQLLW